ncbi:hypothetical protein PG991_007887 [Apiospora marii]|uniref:Uncharacterized protein n=1 Tax=Apiospora marii TaxID=335849 RepID=A0ABR1RV33_9PEZI
MPSWRCYDMPAHTVSPDGTWYYVGSPVIIIIDHKSPHYDNWADSLRYLRNNEWCYYAECDLVIFALFYGDVVMTSEDLNPKDEEEESGKDEANAADSNTDKQQLDEVTDWEYVHEMMVQAHWAFSIERLQAYWKDSIMPRLRAIREANARLTGKSGKNNDGYNALAGLAATCHTRNVDPADHPHGYGKPLPTASELFKDRVCQAFGGKSYEVIKEQEQALKQDRKLKKVKREDDGRVFPSAN